MSDEGRDVCKVCNTWGDDCRCATEAELRSLDEDARIALDGEELTCEAFYESYAERECAALCDELYWDGGYNADQMFSFLRSLAAQKRVHLTDHETFDYDTFFWNVYLNTEKGLS